MGLFSDHFKIEHDGSMIEVESRTENMYLNVYRFALIIDNRRVEDIKASLGRFSLRGCLATGTPIAVRIKQGFFGTRAVLEVDGQSIPMPRA